MVSKNLKAKKEKTQEMKNFEELLEKSSKKRTSDVGQAAIFPDGNIDLFPDGSKKKDSKSKDDDIPDGSDPDTETSGPVSSGGSGSGSSGGNGKKKSQQKKQKQKSTQQKVDRSTRKSLQDANELVDEFGGTKKVLENPSKFREEVAKSGNLSPAELERVGFSVGGATITRTGRGTDIKNKRLFVEDGQYKIKTSTQKKRRRIPGDQPSLSEIAGTARRLPATRRPTAEKRVQQRTGVDVTSPTTPASTRSAALAATGNLKEPKREASVSGFVDFATSQDLGEGIVRSRARRVIDPSSQKARAAMRRGETDLEESLGIRDYFAPKARAAQKKARQETGEFFSSAGTFLSSVGQPIDNQANRGKKQSKDQSRSKISNKFDDFGVQSASPSGQRGTTIFSFLGNVGTRAARAEQKSQLGRQTAEMFGAFGKSAALQPLAAAEQAPIVTGLAGAFGIRGAQAIGASGLSPVAKKATLGAAPTAVTLGAAGAESTTRKSLAGKAAVFGTAITGEVAGFGVTGSFRAAEKARDVVSTVGARRVPAEDVFDVPALRGQQKFPTSSSAQESLAEFQRARAPEGGIEVVSASPKPLSQRSFASRDVDVAAGPMGAAGREDPGLFVTPQGRGSPYFLGREGENVEFSLLPQLRRPTASVVKAKGARRQPESVVQSQGFQEVNRYLGGQVGSGNVFVTARSERGLRGIRGKGSTTTELEGVVPEGTRLQAQQPSGFLGRARGFEEYTTVDGRVVPLRRFSITDDAAAAGTRAGRRTTTPSRLAAESSDLSRSLTSRRRSVAELIPGFTSGAREDRQSRDVARSFGVTSSAGQPSRGGFRGRSRSKSTGFSSFLSGGSSSRGSASQSFGISRGGSSGGFGLSTVRSTSQPNDPFVPDRRRRDKKPKKDRPGQLTREFRFERSLAAVGLGLQTKEGRKTKRNRFAEIAGFGVRR